MVTLADLKNQTQRVLLAPGTPGISAIFAILKTHGARTLNDLKPGHYDSVSSALSAIEDEIGRLGLEAPPKSSIEAAPIFASLDLYSSQGPTLRFDFHGDTIEISDPEVYPYGRETVLSREQATLLRDWLVEALK